MISPLNTKAAVESSPMGMLAEMMVLGSSGAIERQEAQGQRGFVQSDTLPTDGLAKLKGLPGLKILNEVPKDAVFTYVELPDGWTKKPTDHSMWSKLCDEKGRERASIFYKAAFYDRSAHISLRRRFSVKLDYDHAEKTGESVGCVMDGETEIHRTRPLARKQPEYWKNDDEAQTEAKAWLDERHPDWANPLAYWD